MCRISVGLVVAAATEYDDDSEYDDPGAVVIKEIANAVVIHSFLRVLFGEGGRDMPSRLFGLS